MNVFCGVLVVLLVITGLGHLMWLLFATLIRAVFGLGNPQSIPIRRARPFRYCPDCRADVDDADTDCRECGLILDSRTAHDLHRVRAAESEIRLLLKNSHIDKATAETVLEQLHYHAARLRGRPVKTPRSHSADSATPRTHPVTGQPLLPPVFAPTDEPIEPKFDAQTDEPQPQPTATEPEVLSATLQEPASEEVEVAKPAVIPIAAPIAAPSPSEPPLHIAARSEVPAVPKRRLKGFLESHNILWGELVGGLLIVGCSIALVVTLRQALEAIPYFRFLLSAAVTLALFGAGEYTLHRWKLSGTSRGMLVISMLLTPLTLLLLASPFTEGTQGGTDIAVKLAALAAFVGVVRTGGRDLIGTDHLPGPVDRRWLLSLAVVGAAGTQLLPVAWSSPWFPLVCFAVACVATLGGLSWYHPSRREQPISEKSGTALLMFVGLASFALLAAWGLYVIRDPQQLASRFHSLAIPLALAGIPAVEAGVLVLRRVAGQSLLRTMGTAVSLAGFVAITMGLALAWPEPQALLVAAGVAGLYLTRLSFQERVPWVQAGAIPLLAFAVVVAYHGLAGNWAIQGTASASDWFRAQLDSSATGAVLVCVALVCGLITELLARSRSQQTFAYGIASLGVGTVGLLLVNWHGVASPVTATFAHALCAFALLASNSRWQRLAFAHGGLLLIVAATLWALWWQAPAKWALWGFVVAVQAVAFAVLALVVRGTRGNALRLLRRALPDVAVLACVLAVVLAATSQTLASSWHTGTLLAIAVTAVVLARLTGEAVFTGVGAAVALFASLHLVIFTCDVRPVSFAIALAILLHATSATLGALLWRRQPRVFAVPLSWAAKIASSLAVPFVMAPATGFVLPTAALAVWLGALWLVFSLVWRERGAFSAFQGAITLSAILAGYAWLDSRVWWSINGVNFDPRELHAVGISLALLSILWVIARRVFSRNARARDLWCDNAVSFDRIVLAAIVFAFLAFTGIAVVKCANQELISTSWLYGGRVGSNIHHTFGQSAWLLLALLVASVTLSWRLSRVPGDTNPHAVTLLALSFAVPGLWAGTHAVDFATASALRWGLATLFVLASIALACRGSLRRVAESLGFAVEPASWLRTTALAMVAFAAVVVVAISLDVAHIGFNRLTTGGPVAVSVFAQMGSLVSNVIPLALVVCGLAITANRERSAGYAFGGGLVFVATATAGYALAVVTSGAVYTTAEQYTALLVFATAAALWALAWMALAHRIPGGDLLSLQVVLGFVGLAIACIKPALSLFATPELVMNPETKNLSVFGWLPLSLVACSGWWHLRRLAPRHLAIVYTFAGLVAGVFGGILANRWDDGRGWFAFHTAAIVWVSVGVAFLAWSRRRVSVWCLTVFAGLAVVCALRAAWIDPWRPWLSAALAACAALFFGKIALRMRSIVVTGLSLVACWLVAVVVWIPSNVNSELSFALVSAIGLGLGFACWKTLQSRLSAKRNTQWLEPLDAAVAIVFATLIVGLAPVFRGLPTAAESLAWAALFATACACVAGLWHLTAVFARPGLFALGALAVLTAVAQVESRAVGISAFTALALAAYAVVVTGIALVIARRSKPFWNIPETHDSWLWLVVGLGATGVFALGVGLNVSLTAAMLWERVLLAVAVALLAIATSGLVRLYPRWLREPLRFTTATLCVGIFAALAWAIPDPAERFVWLHRNAWLFVAVAGAAICASEFASRVGDRWRLAFRRVAGWGTLVAVAVLCVNLLQQVPAFDPLVRRTPLARETSLAMLLAIAGVFVLLLRFALVAERDPFSLRPTRKTAYVYGAEIMIVLFFTVIRFNVPELFLGNVAKLWTFAVMALAYVGIGFAELFERKKIDVLAVPLRRTGVLLPLIPLIAFWAKPPAFITEFARGSAPGLTPLLGYLEQLPQHFDTYAWLWFLAGGVYGLVALSRNSFGWALLAALATNAAMWSLLAHNNVPFFVHPQAWVIPLALIVLVSEHINRHRLREDISNAMRYAGIAMIYIASAADMFLAGVGSSTWLPVVLAALCVCGVLAGLLLRVRAFVFLGISFLVLDIFAMIWHAAVNLEQTWVWYASGIVLGVIVLALFAILEKRRKHSPPDHTNQ